MATPMQQPGQVAASQRDLTKEKSAIDTFTFSNKRPPNSQEMWQLAQSIYGDSGILAKSGSYQDAFKQIDDKAYQGAGVEQAYGNMQHFTDPTNYSPNKNFDTDITGSIDELNAAIQGGDYEKASALQKGLMTKTGVKSSYTKAFLAGRQLAQNAYEKALNRYQKSSEMEREGYKLDRASKESLAENLFKSAQLVKDFEMKEGAEQREKELQPLKVKELQATINQKLADAAKTRSGGGGGGGGGAATQRERALQAIGQHAQAFTDVLKGGGVIGGQEYKGLGDDGKADPYTYSALKQASSQIGIDPNVFDEVFGNALTQTERNNLISTPTGWPQQAEY